MSGAIETGESDVLLVIDMQRDFCGGGALAVPGADEIVPLVNRAARSFKHVVLTQDWHPPGHHSFASTHSGRRPFEAIEVDYGLQILWPDHCVQGTSGAEFHGALDMPHAELIYARDIIRTSIPIRPFSKTTKRRGLDWPAICASADLPTSSLPASHWISASATPPRTPIGTTLALSCWRMPAGRSTHMAPSRIHGPASQRLEFAASGARWGNHDPSRGGSGWAYSLSVLPVSARRPEFACVRS